MKIFEVVGWMVRTRAGLKTRVGQGVIGSDSVLSVLIIDTRQMIDFIFPGY
jgi:hypothetical protein